MQIKTVEERNLKKIHDIVLKFNQKINDYCLKKFGKPIEIYIKSFYKNQLKNFWEVFNFIENVNVCEIYYEIKDLIEQFFNSKEFLETGLERFLYFEDNINKGKFEQIGKIIVPIGIPYIRKEFIDKIFSGKYVFVLTSFETCEVKEAKEVKEEVSEYDKYFQAILKKAVQKGVSDIHIIPKENQYIVFFRKDGFFIEEKEFRIKLTEGDKFLTYLMRRAAEEVKGGQFNPDVRICYQDARISVPEIGQYDARLAFIPDGFSLRNLEVVIRLLPKRLELLKEGDVRVGLQKLGYLEEDIDVLTSILNKTRGIVVISGITNSGKSTLVSYLLSTIKTKKIGTIEDPIEYKVKNENYVQHQLFLSPEERTSMDFVDYVKAFKRADYDIVYIGEWRNHKGLSEAIIEQAFAGQLIFTTLHIANSFQIFDALYHMYGVEYEKLKSVLLLSFNQVLLPKLCDKCKEERKIIETSLYNEIIKRSDYSVSLDPESKEKIKNFLQHHRKGERLWKRGKGCSFCDGLGYKGRQVVYDYFVPTFDFYMQLKNYDAFSVLTTAKQTTYVKTKLDVYLKLVLNGIFDIADIIGNEFVPSLI